MDKTLYICVQMSDTLTQEQRHRNMAAIRSSATKPELKLRHALWSFGFRYRVNDKRLPGTPDIVLPKYKTVIFVHGCFWHGHDNCNKASTPKTNTNYWTSKIARNRKHDQDIWRQLEAKGWSVIIVWECELKKSTIYDTITRIQLDLHDREVELQTREAEKAKLREDYQKIRDEHKENREKGLSDLFHLLDY